MGVSAPGSAVCSFLGISVTAMPTGNRATMILPISALSTSRATCAPA